MNRFLRFCRFVTSAEFRIGAFVGLSAMFLGTVVLAHVQGCR